MKKPFARIFVENLHDDIKTQILDDFETFEKDGKIGDCVLRRQTEEFMDNLLVEDNVVIWMNIIANECYRYFANKYFEECL